MKREMKTILMWSVSAVFLLVPVGVAQAELRIDFSQTGGPVEAGFQGYFADNDQPDTFTAQDFPAFGTTITVKPSWAPDATPQTTDMMDRGNNDGITDHVDLLRDWIATDNRQPGAPMTLTISGLPAGDYSWLSYHHDNHLQRGVFDVTVTDATGSVTTTDIQITDTRTSGVVNFEDMARFTATIVSDGTNPVTLVFHLHPPSSTQTSAQLMNGFELALLHNPSAMLPSPADKATDVPREVVLSWTPGGFAGQHDVYFGADFSDVNSANASDLTGIYRGRYDVNSYTPPEVLDLGTTYYWRVDEVDGPPDYTVYQGSIWSFTTKPVGYAIENVTATASSSDVGKGPENTVNGSGLDDSGLLHDNIGVDSMWLSSMAGPQPAWIEYEFDNVYKLHEMWVWNSNDSLEPVVGFGLKDVTIEYSVDGANYATLGATHEFARAPGAPDYAHNTTVDLSGVTAKHIKLTANSNWGGFLNQYGLSEVRLLYIPVRATEPNPDSGVTDVDVDVTLSWRAGREAAEHDVYISSDEQAVIDGTVSAATVTETSHGPLSLDLAQTYYWKINEVNMAESPTTWESEVWDFATREFLVVDDFEYYNDLDPGDTESNRIFNVWKDGYEQPTNGSLVGYENPPFCEQTIVHGGDQSMTLFYNNTGGAAYSEAELTLSPPQDWTKHGAKALSLWFYGDPNNAAEQMYVKVNGSKVTYDSDADNLTRMPWQPWNIDLASLAIDLQNVTKFTIGLGDETSMAPGGSGVVLFDDIRLYPYSRQLATPAEPSTAGQVAHYEFEGNANDSSGNGLHGTAMGSPTFVAGKVGQAISLRGLNDFVEITGYKGILGTSAVTVAAWVNTTSTVTGTIAGWGSNVNGQRFGFRIDENRLRIENAGGSVQGDTDVNDGSWHHVAVTVQENATISYPDVILYVNGIDDTRPSEDSDAFNLTADQDVRIGSRPASNDRFFMGLIDDVRIYDRALTPEEIA